MRLLFLFASSMKALYPVVGMTAGCAGGGTTQAVPPFANGAKDGAPAKKWPGIPLSPC